MSRGRFHFSSSLMAPVIAGLLLQACWEENSSQNVPLIPRDGYLQNFKVSALGKTNRAIQAEAKADGAVRWQWTKLAGPGNIQFSDSASAKPWLTADADGFYQIMVTVYDAAGHDVSEIIAMEWDATPPAIQLTTSFQAYKRFSPQALVKGGTSYRWQQVAGPGSLIFSNRDALNTEIEATANGTYTFALVAKDELGNESRSESSLIWDKSEPTVNLGLDLALKLPTIITAKVNGASRLQWQQLSGPGTLTFVSPDKAQTGISADLDGVYTIKLSAFNSAGLAVSDEMTLTWDQTSPKLGLLKASRVGGLKVRAVKYASEAVDLSWKKITGPGELKAGSEVNQHISVDKPGAYELEVSATDVAGNVTTERLKLSFQSDLRVKEVALGKFSPRVCVIDSADDLRCWGYSSENDYSEYPEFASVEASGFGKKSSLPSLPLEVGVDRKPLKVVTSGMHSCVLLDDQSLKCWGANVFGELGLDSIESEVKAPSPILWPRNAKFKDVAVGWSHTCAILASDQSVHCWGNNSKGQLGVGDESVGELRLPSEKAIEFGNGRKAVSLALGFQSSCALLDDGQVSCWGASSLAGYAGAPEKILVPGKHVEFGAGKKVKQLSVGSESACALLDDQTVRCWGELPQETSADRSAVVQVLPIGGENLNQVASVSVGVGHSCVRYLDGKSACWGKSGSHLGYGKGVESLRAPRLEGIKFAAQQSVAEIYAGAWMSCALLKDQALSCWGAQNAGVLGFTNNLFHGMPDLKEIWSPIPWSIDYSGNPRL